MRTTIIPRYEEDDDDETTASSPTVKFVGLREPQAPVATQVLKSADQMGPCTLESFGMNSVEEEIAARQHQEAQAFDQDLDIRMEETDEEKNVANNAISRSRRLWT